MAFAEWGEPIGNEMYDVRRLETIGTPLDQDAANYEEIETEAQDAADGIPIAEPRQRAHGIITPLTPPRRRALGIEAEGALLWWSDGHPDDASSGVNLITASEAARLEIESTAAMIERIVAHYEGREDDGHPAYALYRRRVRERDVQTTE